MFQVRYLLFVKEYFFVIWFISKKEEAETVKRVIQSVIRVSCNNMKTANFAAFDSSLWRTIKTITKLNN